MQEEKRYLGKIFDSLDFVFGWVDMAVYVCMILVVLLQIFARVMLPKVPAWTEELSRYLQVYLVAFGAGLAIKYDSFVSVETVFQFLGRRPGIVLKIIDNLVVFVMFAFFFWYSIEFYELGIPRSAVTMPGITMNVIYFSMILMSISVLFYIIRKEINLVRQLKGGET